MKWTPQQDKALLDVNAWLQDNDGQQVFRLFGYAGTGKTTLAKHLASNVRGGVLFGAYTGKAAHVLNTKGCPAQTIHSLIYRPKDKSKAGVREIEEQMTKLAAELKERGVADPQDNAAYVRLMNVLKIEKQNAQRPMFELYPESPVQDCSLLVLDECSMIDGRMGDDILSFGSKVLVLGDPAQLPPVKGEGYFINGKPDFLLTDVQRQARDNPILELATRVREGKRLQPGSYGSSTVLPAGRKVADILDYSQAITGRNRTRRAWNQRYRALLERGGEMPEPGDRLVCLRNSAETGLLNGAVWIARSSEWVDPYLTMEVQSEDGGPVVTCDVHSEPFKGEDIPFWDKKKAQEFDYGYALTCHKSQGSQWDSVLVCDESACFRDDRDKWLYTAVTRAVDRVTVLQT